MNQRTILWLVCPIVVLLTIMPSTVLAMIGWGYTLFGGNGLTKIHPASYLAMLLTGFLMLFKWHEGHLTGGRIRFVPLPVLAYMVCILAILAFLTLFHGGGSVSFMLDTLMIPGLVIILLLHLTVEQQAWLFKLMIWIFLVNVAIAIGETVIGKRLIPFTVQGIPVLYDRRPTALMGHPLTNAHLTAVAIFFALGCLHTKAARVMVGSFLALGLIAARAGS